MPFGFENDIRPLFRDKDIKAMMTVGQFDLSKYEDVVQRAQDIYSLLKHGDMPCDRDGRWPVDNITLFKKWIDQGFPA